MPVKTYTYEAEITRNGEMDAAYIVFPYNVYEEFGVKGQVKVKAVFDGTVEYRGSLAKMGMDCHVLGLTKAVRSALGKQPGATIEVSIIRDTEPRIVQIHEDFRQALLSAGVLESFQALSYTKQKEMAAALEEAKKPETRLRRIQKFAAGLKETD